MYENSKIITFYSYKGGVGRSMALANVAQILAEEYNVTVIDWDLEGPGLHSFYKIPEENIETGLIDIFYDYKALLEQKKIPTNGNLIDIEKYMIKILGSFKSGSIYLLPSGRFDKDYTNKVNNFNWIDFYENWHGYGFIEYFKRQLKEKSDFILIDSRTGITDTGGICTVQMPDAVVLLFSFNKQNIFGIETMCERINESALNMDKEIPKLILIPSRVEKYLENSLLNDWAEMASQRLSKYIINMHNGKTPKNYISENLIPYSGLYSFGESIISKYDVNKDLLNSYTNLKNLILYELGCKNKYKNSDRALLEEMRQRMEISINSEKEILEVLKILRERETESDTEDSLIEKMNKVIELRPGFPIIGTTLNVNEVVKLYIRWRRKKL